MEVKKDEDEETADGRVRDIKNTNVTVATTLYVGNRLSK